MSKTIHGFIFFLFLLAITVHAEEHHCGTIRSIQHSWAEPKVAFKSASKACDADYLFKTVLKRTTPHFQIFYTLEGPHKTTEVFVDSVVANIEKVWDLQVSKLGMLPPKGMQTAFHYQQNVDKGLYPVEILDIDNVRDPLQVLGTPRCGGCFGITFIGDFPDVQKSELMLDNDFFYVPSTGVKLNTIQTRDGECVYPIASDSITNVVHGYSYPKHWDKGIRVALFHELYHASQIRYLNIYKHINFWFEASATGMEEIGAPDVDDYLRYIPNYFNIIGNQLNENGNNYGISVLFIYLFNHVGQSIDREIWEKFSKNGELKYFDQLSDVLKRKGLAADSIFHDFALRLAFSGATSKTVKQDQWISSDQNLWPTVPYNIDLSIFAPDTTNYTFNFYKNGQPDLTDYKGRGSAIIFSDGQAKIKKIISTSMLTSILTEKNSSDSVIWVFSQFGENSKVNDLRKDSSLVAYPAPWRNGNLCFSPLPQDKNFIEIRNRRGDLIFRESYSGTTHCLDESTIRAKMAPGIYRFRAGSSGKTGDILIIY